MAAFFSGSIIGQGQLLLRELKRSLMATAEQSSQLRAEHTLGQHSVSELQPSRLVSVFLLVVKSIRETYHLISL